MNRSLALTVPAVFVLAVGVAVGTVATGSAQEPAVDGTLAIATLRAQALQALQKGDSETAVLSADAMVRQHPDDARCTRLAADIYLRTGKVDWAARQFDRYLQSEPAEMPGLWQRGIALYFVGDYKRAAKQFEEHRKVNPHDVENAAWHFLCVAKSDSIEAARQLVLPAPNDPRIPMEEVHQMLTSGDTDAVRRRVSSVPEDSPAARRRKLLRRFLSRAVCGCGRRSTGRS